MTSSCNQTMVNCDIGRQYHDPAADVIRSTISDICSPDLRPRPEPRSSREPCTCLVSDGINTCLWGKGALSWHVASAEEVAAPPLALLFILSSLTMASLAAAILVVTLAGPVLAAEDLTTYVSPDVSRAPGISVALDRLLTGTKQQRPGSRVVATSSPASPGPWA